MPERILPEPPDAAKRPLWLRLTWFAALYVGGVASVAVVAYAIRLWLMP